MKHLYIHKDRVVAGENKPDNTRLDQTSNDYIKALKQWEESLLSVKNAHKSLMSDRWYITTVINEVDYDQQITPGTKCEGREENGEYIVTKII